MLFPKSTFISLSLLAIGLSGCTFTDSTVKADAPVTEQKITISIDPEIRGITILTPECIPIGKESGRHEFKYGIMNNTGQEIFVEIEKVNPVSYTYEVGNDGYGAGGGKTCTILGDSGKRFALLPTCCCGTVYRKGLIELPKGIASSGKLTITIDVEGYYLKTGKPFSGSIEIPVNTTP